MTLLRKTESPRRYLGSSTHTAPDGMEKPKLLRVPL